MIWSSGSFGGDARRAGPSRLAAKASRSGAEQRVGADAAEVARAQSVIVSTDGALKLVTDKSPHEYRAKVDGLSHLAGRCS